MKRLFVVLAAYLAACAVGAVLFASYWVFDGGFDANPIGIFGMTVLFGGAAAAPAALPIVLATEAMRRGYWWMFLGAGVIAAAFLLWMFIPDLEPVPVALALVICPIAALTYWFIAWRRFPPRMITRETAHL